MHSPRFLSSIKGSNVSYSWRFSDDNVTQVTTIPATNHTFNRRGTFTAYVTASNAVSSKENSSSITIEDRIQGFTVTAPSAGTTSEPHQFELCMTSGSDYSCYWNFNDGSTPDVTNDITTPGPCSNWSHIFPTEKMNPVNVTCQNNINSESADLEVNTMCVNNATNIGLSIHTNEPVVFSINSRTLARAEAWFTTLACLPNDTLVSMDWGDEKISPKEPFQVGEILENTYTDAGVYPVKATFYYQSGGEDVITATFNVITSMANMQLFFSPQHAIVGEPFNVCVTFDSGDNVTLTCDFGTEFPNETKQRTGKLS